MNNNHVHLSVKRVIKFVFRDFDGHLYKLIVTWTGLYRTQCVLLFVLVPAETGPFVNVIFDTPEEAQK